VHDDSSKAPDSLVPGDKVDANIEGQKFTAEVKVGIPINGSQDTRQGN
jgi:hypothetical protein